MAKAINWPKSFREEILAEDGDKTYAAFRLGTIYFEGQYWVSGEEIDIRCNHLKIRRAIIEGDLKACPIKDLTNDDLSRQKTPLKTQQSVIEFLSTNYNQPVDENTMITVVYYKNLPVNEEQIEHEDDETGRHL